MKPFSNVKICVCHNEDWIDSYTEGQGIFMQDKEYPFDYFFGDNGKEYRVFQIDNLGQPAGCYHFLEYDFTEIFMEKSQWNAQNVRS